ncbi:MAG: hypothetical protein JWP48_6112 [Actinoallomurus sp.]|jgi:hypothetical protein|nr:hypothetical protein [Actinoallomurus sp.]
MDIKWSALSEVALVSFGAGVGIVVIFAVGALAWSQGGSGEDEAAARGGALGNAAAAVCFLACALIAAYGIYLIVPQFH